MFRRLAWLLALVVLASAPGGFATGRDVRSLPGVPQPLGSPAAAARVAAQRSGDAGWEQEMCALFASPSMQGSRSMLDARVPLWHMAEDLGIGVALSDDAAVAKAWGGVIAACNEGDGRAAEGVGWAVAYAYARGLLVAQGTTAALEAALDAADGCKAVAASLDVAAGVLEARHSNVPDELATIMAGYSPRLAACVPRDAATKYVPPTPRSRAASKPAPLAQPLQLSAAGGR